MNSKTIRIVSISALSIALAAVLCGCNAGGQEASSPAEESKQTAATGNDSKGSRTGLLSRVFSKPVVVTVPAGTRMRVEVLETLASNKNQSGDRFSARVIDGVVIDGRTVIPAGSEVSGVVTQAVPLKKIGGRAKLGLEFTTVDPPSGSSSPIKASYFAQGKSETKKDVATIGGAAAGGALLGRIIGHKKGEEARGTAIGAAAGAAAGTAVAAGTKGQEVVIPAGHTLEIRLESSTQVTLKS